jgi:hypothetical protein
VNRREFVTKSVAVAALAAPRVSLAKSVVTPIDAAWPDWAEAMLVSLEYEAVEYVTALDQPSIWVCEINFLRRDGMTVTRKCWTCDAAELQRSYPIGRFYRAGEKF